MKIGVFFENLRQLCPEDGSWETRFSAAKRIGADYLECDWRVLRRADGDFREAFRKSGLGITAYALTDADGLLEDGTPLWEELPRMKERGITQFMAVPGIGLPAGFDQETEEKRVIRTVRKILDAAKEEGISVVMEDFDAPKIPCSTLEEMVRFGEALPELRFTFDTGNFYCFGETAEEAYPVLRDKIRHVHVKDWLREDCFLACLPGDGFLPLEKLLGTLRKDGYDGTVSAEMDNRAVTEESLREAVKRIREWLR